MCRRSAHRLVGPAFPCPRSAPSPTSARSGAGSGGPWSTCRSRTRRPAQRLAARDLEVTSVDRPARAPARIRPRGPENDLTRPSTCSSGSARRLHLDRRRCGARPSLPGATVRGCRRRIARARGSRTGSAGRSGSRSAGWSGGHRAFDGGKPPRSTSVTRDRAEQADRIGMLRIGEQVADAALLDDAAGVHHGT